MKKFVIIILTIVVLIFAASVGYKLLSERYGSNPARPEMDLILESRETTDTGSSPNNQEQTESDTSSANTTTDFTVKNIDEEDVLLSSGFGKPMVVNFWATWCGPCKSELPAFDQAYRDNGDDITFMMVNLTDGYRDTVSSVNSFISKNEYSFPVFFDTEYNAATAYSVYSIPTTLFIKADGTLYKTHTGTMSQETLTTYLNELMTE